MLHQVSTGLQNGVCRFSGMGTRGRRMERYLVLASTRFCTPAGERSSADSICISACRLRASNWPRRGTAADPLRPPAPSTQTRLVSQPCLRQPAPSPTRLHRNRLHSPAMCPLHPSSQVPMRSVGAANASRPPPLLVGERKQPIATLLHHPSAARVVDQPPSTPA